MGLSIAAKIVYGARVPEEPYVQKDEDECYPWDSWRDTTIDVQGASSGYIEYDPVRFVIVSKSVIRSDDGEPLSLDKLPDVTEKRPEWDAKIKAAFDSAVWHDRKGNRVEAPTPQTGWFFLYSYG